MSTIRVRKRADKSTHTQICFRHNGVQTSESVEDQRDRPSLEKLLDEVGPDEARRFLAAQVRAAADQTVLLGDWLPPVSDRSPVQRTGRSTAITQ
ncbi:hypothetical protein [Nocardia sp. NPDC046763]|uniref:hypothetical protein n=1 Tax=Nocardia sp. NPDC046763 TaxID=3155256 RepID=UPI0033F323FF